MRNRAIKIALVALVLAIASPIQAGSANEDPGDVRELEPNPPGGIPSDPVTPMPRPVLPAPNVLNDGQVQLVTYTHTPFQGDRGVLTFAQACNKMYAGSRMCTIDEINLTQNAPEPPRGSMYAWVQVPGSLDDVLVDYSKPLDIKRPGSELPRITNCRGWNSASRNDLAMAIRLFENYGSCIARSCDTALVVACCAIPHEARN